MKEDKTESWLNRKWRPMMAVMYFVVCITDFILFPILWSLLQANFSGVVTIAWAPITLMGGGTFHLALGAILGISAWTRGKEKLAGLSRSYKYTDETYYNNDQLKPIRPSKVPVSGIDEEL